jgi:predicted CXXCH cytochrome family protein
MISPYSHIYRLVLILIIGSVGFFWGKSLFVPDSWDFDRFYRVDALEELKHQPMRHGGNDSCAAACHADQLQSSHQERFDALARGKHKGLACENCHGPLSLHASEGKKTQPALINREGKLCLRCHAQLISRPSEFAQFDIENNIGHWYFDVQMDSTCQKCHDPHEPRYMTVAKAESGEKHAVDTSDSTDSNIEEQDTEPR